LLVTCAPQAVAEVLSLFRDAGFASAAVIGQMQAGAARITVDYRLDLPAEVAATQVAEVPG
jgi:selenide,water dikinase